MRKSLLIIIFVLFNAHILSAEEQEKKEASPKILEHWRPSLSAVVATPEKHVGTQVSLTGYLHQVPDQSMLALFLTRDHALILDYASSVLIGPAKSDIAKRCAGQFVTVVGEFERMTAVTAQSGLLYTIPRPRLIFPRRAGDTSKPCWPDIR